MALKATRWKIITIVHTDVCEAKHTVAKSEFDEASAAWANSKRIDEARFCNSGDCSEKTKKLLQVQHEKFGTLIDLNRQRAIDRGESGCGCPIHATDPVEPELKERAEVLHAGDVKGWSLVRTERDGDWVIGYWEEDLA